MQHSFACTQSQPSSIKAESLMMTFATNQYDTNVITGVCMSYSNNGVAIALLHGD